MDIRRLETDYEVREEPTSCAMAPPPPEYAGADSINSETDALATELRAENRELRAQNQALEHEVQSLRNEVQSFKDQFKWEFVVEHVVADQDSRYAERGGDFRTAHREWCRRAEPLSVYEAKMADEVGQAPQSLRCLEGRRRLVQLQRPS